jgi:hypothetical protein
MASATQPAAADRKSNSLEQNQGYYILIAGVEVVRRSPGETI